MRTNEHVQVLYSFPLRLGADRICGIAWQQVNGLSAAEAGVLAFPASISRPLRPDVKVSPTLAKGKLRVPYKLVGTMRGCAWHDHIVARRLEKMVGQIDIIHAWPLGALETLESSQTAGNSDRAGKVQCAHRFCNGSSATGVRSAGSCVAARS